MVTAAAADTLQRRVTFSPGSILLDEAEKSLISGQYLAAAAIGAVAFSAAGSAMG
jgi:hypothetical protein